MTRAQVVARLRVAIAALAEGDRQLARRIADGIAREQACASRRQALDTVRKDRRRLADERAQEIVEARA